MQSKPQRELIRIVLEDGVPRVDATGRAHGRGAYLCRCPECFEAARKKRSFSRTFRTNVSDESLDDLRRRIEALTRAEEGGDDRNDTTRRNEGGRK
jgi:predicted RNA-binding protein YlxR (DUF448 family)